MHPLDMVKTCLQLQRPRHKAVGVTQYYYRSTIHCVWNIYRKRGITAFWQGVVPAAVVETPRRAVNFLLFENYQQYFLFGSPPEATPLTHTIAGLLVGFTEGIVVTPFDRVKIVQIASKLPVSKTPSTLAILKRIVSTEGYGVNGLYRGLGATMASYGTYNMVYYGVYSILKGHLPSYSVDKMHLPHIMEIGFTAGTLASVASLPFDVAKTRIQGPQRRRWIKYQTTFATMATIYREERLISLFKGLLPRLLKRGIGSALMEAVYDFTYRFLTGFDE